jgi:hypothetical protein
LEKEKVYKPQKYLSFTFRELILLFFCIILDVIEYLVKPLLAPIIGDLLDLIGITVSIFMFGWIGALSMLELVPGLDILPIYSITWITWYYMKKDREKKEREKFQKKWK